MSLSTQSSQSSNKVSVQEIFKVNSSPEAGVSICIPRVFNNINYRRIKEIFIGLRWGFVERVDVVPMGQFKRAYVHFAPGRWNTNNRQATEALEGMKEYSDIQLRLQSAKNETDRRGIDELTPRLREAEVKILYDDPWFWKVGISLAPRAAEPPKPKPRTQVSIGTKLGDHLTHEQRDRVSEDGEIVES